MSFKWNVRKTSFTITYIIIRHFNVIWVGVLAKIPMVKPDVTVTYDCNIVGYIHINCKAFQNVKVKTILI